MSTEAITPATGALPECLACGAHELVVQAPAEPRCGSCHAIHHVHGRDTWVTGSAALVLRRMPTPPSLEVTVQRPTSLETSPYRQDAGEAPACVVVRGGDRPSPLTWLLMVTVLAIGVLMMLGRHLFLTALCMAVAVSTLLSIMRVKRWELRVQGGRAEHVILPLGGGRSKVHHVMAAVRPEQVRLLHHHVPGRETEDGRAFDRYSVVVVNDEGPYDCGSFVDCDKARFLFRILLGSVPGSADELPPTFTPRDSDEP